LALLLLHPRQSIAWLFQTGRIDNGDRPIMGSSEVSRADIDVEKSYGQKAALDVGALR
jgi:hypothetical protein